MLEVTLFSNAAVLCWPDGETVFFFLQFLQLLCDKYVHLSVE